GGRATANPADLRAAGGGRRDPRRAAPTGAGSLRRRPRAAGGHRATNKPGPAGLASAHPGPDRAAAVRRARAGRPEPVAARAGPRRGHRVRRQPKQIRERLHRADRDTARVGESRRRAAAGRGRRPVPTRPHPMNRVRDLRVRPDVLYLASGWSALVTDTRGRIEAGTHGFYRYNTRVLSRERITVDGREPVELSTGNVGTVAQLSYAALGDSEHLPSQAVYLLRERFLGDGLRTRLRVLSFAAQPLRLAVRVELAADFVDNTEAERGRPVPPADVASR